MKHAYSYKKITPEDLHAHLLEHKETTVINCLPQTHFEKVHLPNSQCACVYEMTFLDQVKGLVEGSSSPIVVYGASSNSLDSRTAAEKLSMAGYSDVTVLEGGIERWRQARLPLEGSDIEESSGVEQATLKEGEYTVLVKESLITWTGRNPNSSHYGTVNISGGNLTIRDAVIQGFLTVDMDSIDNINLAGSELHSVLISHLKSDDFFFVDAFPAARLDIRNGRYTPEQYPSKPNCEITGTLDLRGIQNDLSFGATVVKGTDGNLHLTAHFDLDRTLWGIIYGSGKFYEHLGMHTVFDNISLELRLVAAIKE